MLSIYLSIDKATISIYPSATISIYLSIYLSVYLSIYQSINQSIYLSIFYLSIYLYMYHVYMVCDNMIKEDKVTLKDL